jgi:hypothetical protein
MCIGQTRRLMLQKIIGHVFCCVPNPPNRELAFYTPLPIPDQPWDSSSMYFLGVLMKTRQGRDYLFVEADIFNNMTQPIPYKKVVTEESTSKLFFQNIWMHFGLRVSIVSNRDNIL